MMRTWEYRVFRLTERVASAECREDVYYPLSKDCGVKLRDGDPEYLEVKRLIQRDGDIELWQKTLHRDCVNADLSLRLDKVRKAINIDGIRKYEKLRILCRKEKRDTRVGEDSVCTFRIFQVDGDKLLFQEHYTSSTVELSSAESCRRFLSTAPLIDDNSIVASYPAMICILADRALTSFLSDQNESALLRRSNEYAV